MANSDNLSILEQVQGYIQTLKKREEELKKYEATLNQRTEELNKREKSLNDLTESLNRRQRELISKEDEIDKLKREIDAKSKDLDIKDKELQASLKKANELIDENNKMKERLQEQVVRLESEEKSIDLLIRDLKDHIKSVIEGKEVQHEEMIPCPNCGTMISKDALICYNCGFELASK